jgi:hypothetical protein
MVSTEVAFVSNPFGFLVMCSTEKRNVDMSVTLVNVSAVMVDCSVRSSSLEPCMASTEVDFCLIPILCWS